MMRTRRSSRGLPVDGRPRHFRRPFGASGPFARKLLHDARDGSRANIAPRAQSLCAPSTTEKTRRNGSAGKAARGRISVEDAKKIINGPHERTFCGQFSACQARTIVRVLSFDPFCDSPAVATTSETKNRIVARLDQAIAEQCTSREAVSLKAKLDRGYLQKIAARPDAVPRADTLVRLARAASIPESELLAIANRTQLPQPKAGDQTMPAVPILGLAEGSVLSSRAPVPDPIGYIARPPGLTGVNGAYAVIVQGESMAPRHKSGELRFVHPFKQISAGDDVIIQIINPKSEIETYIKTYRRKNGEWLLCAQLNPDAEVKYKLESVKSIHKVLGLNELFNI